MAWRIIVQIHSWFLIYCCFREELTAAIYGPVRGDFVAKSPYGLFIHTKRSKNRELEIWGGMKALCFTRLFPREN